MQTIVSKICVEKEVQEYQKFVQMTKDDRFQIVPVRYLKDTDKLIDGQYVFHTAWAARILAETRPEKHVDFSSSEYFNAITSSFVPIDSYNFKPHHFGLDNLQTLKADLTNLDFEDNSLPSVSCMHVIEHIGLGRYGEVIDPEGDLKAIKELKRVIGGDLLFVVPLSGAPRVIFNAHRIYSYKQIIGYFDGLKLIEFSLIPDGTRSIIKNATEEMANKQFYGCGCFWFRKEME